MSDLISREAAIAIATNRESHAKGETARACRGIAVSLSMLPAAPAVKVKPLLDLADKIQAEERNAASWGGPDPRGPQASIYALKFVQRLRDEARILAALEGGEA